MSKLGSWSIGSLSIVIKTVANQFALLCIQRSKLKFSALMNPVSREANSIGRVKMGGAHINADDTFKFSE